jgi:restriction endonuclease-like protein
MTRTSGKLRQELIARNTAYAETADLRHVMSYGKPSVVVYQQSECGRYHGNFIASSYRAILNRPQWKRRLQKVHTQAKQSLPKDSIWCELDSCTSSDALLMNIFCYPRLNKSLDLALFLGTEIDDVPAFGFMPRVPLVRDIVERTEVDMKLGKVLFEAKLTESDFQMQSSVQVEQYRDLEEVFDCEKLPRRGDKYISYQLIRNVLAAYALDLSFCVLLDARRQDLLEQWYQIMSCVRSVILQTRCKVLTWQELSAYLPATLSDFLKVKYGIEPPIYS